MNIPSIFAVRLTKQVFDAQWGIAIKFFEMMQ
jgi:hypothetical protein